VTFKDVEILGADVTRQADVPAIEPTHGAAPLYDGRGQLCTAIRRFPGRSGDDEYEVDCWA
jgi:hypothetical protein